MSVSPTFVYVCSMCTCFCGDRYILSTLTFVMFVAEWAIYCWCQSADDLETTLRRGCCAVVGRSVCAYVRACACMCVRACVRMCACAMRMRMRMRTLCW